jgi:hypothetical protein
MMGIGKGAIVRMKECILMRIIRRENIIPLIQMKGTIHLVRTTTAKRNSFRVKRNGIRSGMASAVVMRLRRNFSIKG